jgi:ApaG protein
MPAQQFERAPVSEAITRQVRVEVLSRHSPENSRQGEWVFEYTVRITNLGSETIQLLSRRWIISDALERIREIQGPGVVGEQPIIAPGESFQYSSWCPLETPTGSMQGTYQMVRAGTEHFDVDIAPFGLRAPYTVQ